jgi:hypothetical protein
MRSPHCAIPFGMATDEPRHPRRVGLSLNRKDILLMATTPEEIMVEWKREAAEITARLDHLVETAKLMRDNPTLDRDIRQWWGIHRYQVSGARSRMRAATWEPNQSPPDLCT